MDRPSVIDSLSNSYSSKMTPIVSDKDSGFLNNHSMRRFTDSSLESSTATFNSCGNGITTPIRPRPIHASSTYSFDSGYEVSPICHCSFRYGDSVPSQPDRLNRSQLAAQNESDFVDESIEGDDEELISIGHHFTPISSPNSNQVTSNAFTFDSQSNLANLRIQNQNNRQTEVNNNDVFFPNQNPVEDDFWNQVFTLEEGDDDVFLDDDADIISDISESAGDEPYFERLILHADRPSCAVVESELDPLSIQSDQQTLRNVLFSNESYVSNSSSSSRRSSTPIPIPKISESADAIDSFPEPSVPRGAHMPYYHRMAPPLNRPNPLIESDQDEEQRPRLSANTRRNFGTHFETSCSIISRNLIPSCYSPPPLNMVNWSNFRFRFGRLSPCSVHLGFPNADWPRRSVNASIPNDFRVLTPHLEQDEYEEFTESSFSSSASSFGLLFNFSQLSVNDSVQFANEQSEEDIQDGSVVPDEPQLPVVQPVGGRRRRHTGATDLPSAAPEPLPSAAQQFYSDLDLVPPMERRSRQRESLGVVTSDDSGHCRNCREPLPDVIATSTRRYCRQTSSAAAAPFGHRNTLPSFHEVPYSANNDSQQQWDRNFAMNERRTMSVSLPIDHSTIVTVASRLRQMGDEFSSSFQLQRSSSLIRRNLFRTVFELITNFYPNDQPDSVSGSSSVSRQQQPQRQSPTVTASGSNSRGGSSRSSAPTRVVVNNSIFYTESISGDKVDSGRQPLPMPLTPIMPTTTGNSIFYVGSSSSKRSAVAPKRK